MSMRISALGRPASIKGIGVEPGDRGRVHDHPLENRQIFEIASAALTGDATQRLRAAALVSLADLHEFGLPEHLQMTTEVAVGQCAQFLEISKRKPSRVCDERG